MTKRNYVIATALAVALTPAVAAIDSQALVLLHLLTLAAAVAKGIEIHNQLKKGTAQ
jgi:uncharacterized protein (DUF58 family)